MPNLKKMDHITRIYYKLRGNLSVKEGVLWRDDGRLVAPKSMYREIPEQMHKGHTGIVRLKRKLRVSYWWPGMSMQARSLYNTVLSAREAQNLPQTTTFPSLKSPPLRNLGNSSQSISQAPTSTTITSWS
ncbi:MAG: hypothetical protein GY696_25695 [Gammaproteobacteria bacterium]|nr:hypothetical protein [Gammaproteobacteria bacterium]